MRYFARFLLVLLFTVTLSTISFIVDGVSSFVVVFITFNVVSLAFLVVFLQTIFVPFERITLEELNEKIKKQLESLRILYLTYYITGLAFLIVNLIFPNYSYKFVELSNFTLAFYVYTLLYYMFNSFKITSLSKEILQMLETKGENTVECK